MRLKHNPDKTVMVFITLAMASASALTVLLIPMGRPETVVLGFGLGLMIGACWHLRTS